MSRYKASPEPIEEREYHPHNPVKYALGCPFVIAFCGLVSSVGFVEFIDWFDGEVTNYLNNRGKVVQVEPTATPSPTPTGVPGIDIDSLNKDLPR